MTTNVNITAYAYGELSNAAQERVYRDWLDSGDLENMFALESYDIDNALEQFSYLVDANYEHYHDSVTFSDVEFYRAVENADGVDDYAGIGTCYGWDIAQAFNAHVPALQRLRDAVENAEEREAAVHGAACYDVMRAQDAYCAEYQRALDDAAAVYARLCSDAFDYYICHNGARELWCDDYQFIYTEFRSYDVNGADITDIVERYA